jgi:hypothetical protein
MHVQMLLTLSVPVYDYVIAESYQIPVPTLDVLNGVMKFVSNNQIKLHPAKKIPKVPAPTPARASMNSLTPTCQKHPMFTLLMLIMLTMMMTNVMLEYIIEFFHLMTVVHDNRLFSHEIGCPFRSFRHTRMDVLQFLAKFTEFKPIMGTLFQSFLPKEIFC